MKLDNLNAQLECVTNKLIVKIEQADKTDRYTCDKLQAACNDLLIISTKLTGRDSDTTTRMVRVNHRLNRMLKVNYLF